MIQGTVNANNEATIRIPVHDANGQPHDVEAVIDTGFTGYLTLPGSFIATLGLPWLAQQQALLADGSLHVFDVFAARIVWDGLPRVVPAEEVDAQPLVGMAMLRDHELRIQVRPGTGLTITALP